MYWKLFKCLDSSSQLNQAFHSFVEKSSVETKEVMKKLEQELQNFEESSGASHKKILDTMEDVIQEMPKTEETKQLKETVATAKKHDVSRLKKYIKEHRRD